MLLSLLFKNAPNIDIKQLTIDSRAKANDGLFFCLSGIKYDGHDFIKEAIDNGNKVIVYSKDLNIKYNAIYIKVNDVPSTFEKVANAFYNNPTKNIFSFLISGKYGKSSVAKIINGYLNINSKCGYVGTFGVNYDKNNYTINSTPNVLDNIRILNDMVNKDCKYVTFEADISDLNLRKLNIIKPNIFLINGDSSISSQLSKNESKNYQRFLYSLEDECRVILNYDDGSYELLKDCINNYVTYGTNKDCDYYISDIVLNNNGLSFSITFNDSTYKVKSKLLTMANVYNIASSIVCLIEGGQDINSILEYINKIDYIDGVIERVDNTFDVIVDCCYDLCSIEQICKFFKEQGKKDLIVIAAINYNDDDTRIKNMMNIFNKYADKLILTEDASSSEEMIKILERCKKYKDNTKTLLMPYRSLAIKNGIDILNSGDTLLVLGKGNERFLVLGLGKEYYNGDKYYCKKYIKERKEDIDEIS